MHAAGRTQCFCLLCKVKDIDALRVSSKLLDLVGWQFLGEKVKLLPVFAEESLCEVVRLLPSAIFNREAPAQRGRQQQDTDLLVSFGSLEELTNKIGRRFPLTKLDEIIIGL
jgi:hypothetical protein